MAWLDCVIDVSKWQGAIDWSKVDASILLVFVKAMQGVGHADPRYVENRDGIRSSGRLCIPYIFLTAEDPDLQIDAIERVIDPNVPLLLDWEGPSHSTAMPADVEYIGETVQMDMGCQPVLYCGIAGSRPGELTDVMKKWAAMRPRYRLPNAASFSDLSAGIVAQAPALLGSPLPRFWQYTEHGRVAGINGFVDRSVWNGTADELRAWYNSTGT